MTSALIIADYILATSRRQLTPMQVNKLTYISHGFTMAIRDKPLFGDEVQAWRYGPVIASIYHAFKQHRDSPIPALNYCGTPLESTAVRERMDLMDNVIPDGHQSVIKEVLGIYGKFSGLGLSTITHAEGSPWHQCYRPNEIGTVIPDEITKEYYRGQLQRPPQT